MALTLQPQTTGTMGLAEFVEIVEHELVTDDVDALCALAPAFAQLLGNPRLIAECVESELRDWRDLDRGTEYVSHTLVLVRRPRFLVRVNVWAPPPSNRPAPKADDLGFGYLTPHDHNFAFMTGGYYGPGYTTYLYEYDGDAVDGTPGEHVELRPLETTTLPQGKIMVYRPARDVHFQAVPDAYSVSLNLIVPGRFIERPQYLFDVASQTIARRRDERAAYGISLCELASHVGDDDTAQLLADVAERSPRPGVRAAAAHSLRILRPEQEASHESV